jgi:hypothetical protein
MITLAFLGHNLNTVQSPQEASMSHWRSFDAIAQHLEVSPTSKNILSRESHVSIL